MYMHASLPFCFYTPSSSPTYTYLPTYICISNVSHLSSSSPPSWSRSRSRSLHLDLDLDLHLRRTCRSESKAMPYTSTPPSTIITPDNHGGLITITAAVGMTFALSSMGIRIYARTQINGPWSHDDSALLASAVRPFFFWNPHPLSPPPLPNTRLMKNARAVFFLFRLTNLYIYIYFFYLF